MTGSRATYKAGLSAEMLASWWLRVKGYRILAHRFKTPLGEVDLLAHKGETLCLIEVKQRATLELAASAISPRQRERLVNAARFALAHWPEFSEHTIRFDAVLVAPRRWPRHIINAWSENAAAS